MWKFEKKKHENSDSIYDFNFFMYNVSGFGILENPEKWKQRIYSVYYKIMHLIYIFLISNYVVDAYLVFDDKSKLNLNLCVTIVTTGSLFKIWALMKKLKVVVEMRRKFRDNFNLPYVGHEKSHEEIMEKSSQQILRITKALYVMSIPMATIWMTFPLVDTSTKERKFFIPFPTVTDTTTPTFELVYTFHSIMLVHFVSNIMNNDLLIMGFLIRLCGQFDILIHNISKIKDVYPKLPFEKLVPGYKDAESYNEENCIYKLDGEKIWKVGSKECINLNAEYSDIEKDRRKKEAIKLMRQNIDHHRCILKQLDDINYAYGGQFFIQMTAGALVISVVAFDIIVQSRKLNAAIIQQLLYVGCVSVDIFLLCYYGTQIEEKSEQVAQALYDIPWHEMDCATRKTCLFMFAKCRRYPRLQASYVFTLDLETYLSLVKTSYNFMALLNEST